MTVSRGLAIGLDLGGTKILSALINEEGRIVTEVEMETLVSEGAGVVYNQVVTAINSLLDKSQVDKNRLLGIGIAAAGVIDTLKKEVVYANNLGWDNMPVGSLLESEFSLPVHIMNDANAAAIAERKWGAGKGTDNLIYITVSTGIGAGIISNGNLITGEGGSAGEFGHISIDPNGASCSCGNRGCLENMASGSAIAHRAQHRLKNGETSDYFTTSANISSEDIGKASQAGDTFSLTILKEAATYIGVGVTNLIHLLNTEFVVFGGGVMNMSNILLPEIKKTVEKRGIPSMTQKVKIVKTELGINAGVLGAACVYFETSETEVLIASEK